MTNEKNAQKKCREIYVGLDIGTDSVGYAVTDEQYNIPKYHGQQAWGITLFDAGSLCEDRRSFRTARRRLDRRQQRVDLIQELFAGEIEKVDRKFYQRIQESSLYREDSENPKGLFLDDDFTDRGYYEKYPTIHHLIYELMTSSQIHDVRLVYLACAWLVAHRGHFLSNINVKNLSNIKDFKSVYDSFIRYFIDNGFDLPWECESYSEIGDILKEKIGVIAKNKKLMELLYEGKKPSKEATENFPFSREAIVRLMAGGSCKIKDVFGNDEYADNGSVSMAMEDEKLIEIFSELTDEEESLLIHLRAIYDWATLVDILGEFETISASKIQVYEQHRKDLRTLKELVRIYVPKQYNEIFREEKKGNYPAYAYRNKKDTSIEEFSKYITAIFKEVTVEEDDEIRYRDMMTRLESRTFMPKQVNTDNRVIPCQLYQYELMKILEMAQSYLPFLNETDEDNISVKDKIISVFTFRIPYFVGPLNEHSGHAWIKRKAGIIFPWNFEKMVDLDASEMEFIKRMTNRCTYLPGEPVIAKDSLLYHKFMVLNEINNLQIRGQRISVELKQAIYRDLFMQYKKVTKSKLMEYLIAHNIIEKGEESQVTGIDVNINSNLSSQIAFRKLIESGTLTEDDVEKIIERSTYSEDKQRLSKWLANYYPSVSETDRKYICSIKIKDFGRFSKHFLDGLEGVEKSTGEVYTMIGALWSTSYNLMEILSDKFTFQDEIRSYNEEYYAGTTKTLAEKMDDMYLSNAVRRPIYRTLAILKDIEKAFGIPDKIFVETTRGSLPEEKGKRKLSRKQKILELYKKCDVEDVRILKKQLEEMGEYADNKLQSEKLFLYYMQLGKCMYSGKPIELEKLGTRLYDVDHIYPQAYVDDDSILNNKVLVLSEENGKKKDIYPIAKEIRDKMTGYWKFLKDSKLIEDEKYRRLTRNTPFSPDERMGFINRQLVETSQTAKAVATLLKEKYPDTEIVYCKARVASKFRQEFGLLKSRTFNDFHHAVDAYLNVVTGNVYNMKFTKKWFTPNKQYSLNIKPMFTHPQICGGITVWTGTDMLEKVKRIAAGRYAHYTKYAYYKHGGFFDQMPVKAAKDLVPIKKGLDTQKYGGYNKSGAMFYIPVRYQSGKKNEIFIMSVEMMVGRHFLQDPAFAKEYAGQRLEQILGKKVEVIEFPMGMRPWKVNTMLSLDGFRVCITGISGGGKTLIVQNAMQFTEHFFWSGYLKKVERLVEKCSNHSNYIYDEEYDKISYEKNVELYDLYIAKYRDTIWRKRVNHPLATLESGRQRFLALSVPEQAKAILNIHQTFGRISSGCDLTAIGGSKRTAATVNFSASMSNWKKKYTDVRLIDSSVSGLWETRSENLLELL